MDDASLVRAALEGDRAAFAVLVERHRALVLGVCRRALDDPGLAEDVLQEASLLAWLNLASLREPSRVGAWMAGIGLHVCLSWRRYRSHDVWSLDAMLGGQFRDEPIDTSPGPDVRAEEADLGRRVRQAVGALPPGQRAAVALFYLAGLSHREIAVQLDVQVSAVKTRLHKARGALRRSLFEELSTMITAGAFIDVHMKDVLRVPSLDRCVVLLEANDGPRILPIWIGRFEADSIAILLTRIDTPRPLTFAFALRLLEATGGVVSEVRINRLAEETFYAEVVIDGPVGQRAFDARPSDAIALALATGAPLRVAIEVLDQAGRSPAEIEEKTPDDAQRATLMVEEIKDWSQKGTTRRERVY